MLAPDDIDRVTAYHLQGWNIVCVLGLYFSLTLVEHAQRRGIDRLLSHLPLGTPDG